MNIQHLRYFEAIYRNKSITKTAKELNISQPALSNQLKLLEESLEFQLFDRTTRKLIPTESGQVLYRYVSKLSKDLENLDIEVEEIRNTGGGLINIGMIESAKNWLPYIIKQFNTEYPKVRIKINEMSAQSIENAVDNYDVHFGITARDTNLDNLNSRIIYEEELILITSLNHALKNHENVDFIKLKGENFIQSIKEYQLQSTVNNTSISAGIELSGNYEIERLDTARSLVAADLGVTIVPNNYLKYSHSQNIHSVRLNNPKPVRNVYLTFNNNRNLTPATIYFMKLIEEFFLKN